MKLSMQHAMANGGIQNGVAIPPGAGRVQRATVAPPAPAPAAPPTPAAPRIPQGVTQPRLPAPDPRSGGYNGAPVVRAVNELGRATVDTVPATIYGCCGLFDLCGDADLMSLSFAGADRFLDWIGWEPTSICKIVKNFITWERPAYSNGSATAGYVSDPCADGNSVEWGSCDFTLTDFGRLRRVTPTRDLTRVGLRLCESQPRYRLDGSPITDDSEYDIRIVTEVLLQDLRRMLVSGSKSTPGQFDGLEALVQTGYTNSTGRICAMMDSIVVDWNANDFDGGSGITWNSNAVGTTYSFIDVLLAVFRRIKQRISMAPTLSAPLSVGDMVFAAPSHVLSCLLNAYTCWSVCPGVQYREANLNTFDARSFRDNLNGGMFGAGRIFLDGFEIPLVPYDWGLIKGPTRSDGYLLTGRIGSNRLISGQYNDMRVAAGVLPNWYDVMDGGRILSYVDTDNTCYTRTVEMDPRLLMWAPWAQARFMDIVCNQPGGFISADPTETSFYPETSFSVAKCD